MLWPGKMPQAGERQLVTQGLSQVKRLVTISMRDKSQALTEGSKSPLRSGDFSSGRPTARLNSSHVPFLRVVPTGTALPFFGRSVSPTGTERAKSTRNDNQSVFCFLALVITRT